MKDEDRSDSVGGGLWGSMRAELEGRGAGAGGGAMGRMGFTVLEERRRPAGRSEVASFDTSTTSPGASSSTSCTAEGGEAPDV